MAVSERAQVPTQAQRRAAALERSRSNLTLLSIVLAVSALVASGFGVAIAGDGVESGGIDGLTILIAAFVMLAVPFSAAAGAAAFVLSAQRDATLEEG